MYVRVNTLQHEHSMSFHENDHQMLYCLLDVCNCNETIECNCVRSMCNIAYCAVLYHITFFLHLMLNFKVELSKMMTIVMMLACITKCYPVN